MFHEPLAGAVPLSLEPLQTTDAHAYWQTFVSGRTDLPTSDLKVHLDRYLALPPEEQRSHFSVKRDGRIIGTVRLGPAEISGFSMDPTSREEVAGALLKSMDLLRAGGATSITAHFEDIYESAFSSLGFQRVFARMRMEAPTRRSVVPAGVVLQPPEEDEVLGLTKFLMDVYEGHMEQQYGIHTGPEEEWRGYVAGLFKGDSGQFMPDASQGERFLPHAAGKLTVWPSAWRRVAAGARIRKPIRLAYRCMIPRMYRPPIRAVATISALVGAGSRVSCHRSVSISRRTWRHAR